MQIVDLNDTYGYEKGFLEPCDPIPEKVRELEERVKVLENIIAGIETK